MIRLLLSCFILFAALPVFSYGEEHPYNVNWYVHTDKREFTNKDRKMFDPPAVGTPTKHPNKFQRILYRGDKRHVIPYNRYNSHITDREYTDCSYYLYVDCSNFTFCRCWQCRDYVYPIVRTDY